MDMSLKRPIKVDTGVRGKIVGCINRHKVLIPTLGKKMNDLFRLCGNGQFIGVKIHDPVNHVGRFLKLCSSSRAPFTMAGIDR